MYIDSVNSNNGDYAICGFNNVLICSSLETDQNKVVNFPIGYTTDSNMSFKVVFVNGYTSADNVSYMTLNDTSTPQNNIPVVVNQYGTLIPLPIHEITESGITSYKSLQANTILELYYTSDYDGNGNPAYVVIGNPIVLSSSNYTIYADSYIEKDTEFLISIESGGADDPTAQTGSTYTYTIPMDYGIKVGDVIKVTFAQELQSSSAITTVNLSCGGQSGAIVTVQPDTTITNQPTSEYKWIASHEFTGGNYSATYKHKVWDANTILELTWTGTYWLSKSESIVCSYAGTNQSYTVYSSGYIEILRRGVGEVGTINFSFYVKFKNQNLVTTSYFRVGGGSELTISRLYVSDTAPGSGYKNCSCLMVMGY